MDKLKNKIITVEDVMEALNVSLRTVYRYMAKFKELGPP
jgi:predicted DNA-binding transcriptional regulator YafY